MWQPKITQGKDIPKLNSKTLQDVFWYINFLTIQITVGSIYSRKHNKKSWK